VNQQLDVAHHVQVAGGNVHKLHRALLPVAVHEPQRQARPDDIVLHVAGIDAGGHFQKPRLPAFALPAMRRVGVDRQAGVAGANLDQQVEIIRAHGARAGMNLMRQIHAQGPGMLADFGRLLDEPLLAFLEQVVIAALPEPPRVAGGQFPAKRHAPEHGHNLHSQLRAQIQQPQNIILRPFLDALGRLPGHVAGNERANGRTARPRRRMHPERAVRRNAIQFQFGLGKGILDLFGALEAFIALQHEVGWLRPRRPGLFRIIQKLRQTFRAVLRAFDAGMKTMVCHSSIRS